MALLSSAIQACGCESSDETHQPLYSTGNGAQERRLSSQRQDFQPTDGDADLRVSGGAIRGGPNTLKPYSEKWFCPFRALSYYHRISIVRLGFGNVVSLHRDSEILRGSGPSAGTLSHSAALKRNTTTTKTFNAL